MPSRPETRHERVREDVDRIAAGGGMYSCRRHDRSHTREDAELMPTKRILAHARSGAHPTAGAEPAASAPEAVA